MDAPSSLSVCVIGDDKLASQLAKKGSETDIRMYNYKKGKKAITVSSSFRFPEKIQSLIQAVNISEICVICIEDINKEFGESVMALDALGMKKGYIILKNYLSSDLIMPYIKNTVLENYELFQGDVNELRECLFQQIPDELEEQPPSVIIDQAFNVKGIGTVALGIVRDGTIRKHDNLTFYPSEKSTIIRSIQVHDENTDFAPMGSRVGLALKNISSESISKGQILSGTPVPFSDTVELEMDVFKYFQGGLKKGDIFHFVSGLQIIPGRIYEGSIGQGKSGFISLKLEKPCAFIPSSIPAIFHLDRFPRPVGKINNYKIVR